MPSLEAVTPQRHGSQFWHPSPNYQFAAHDMMATLAVSELPVACMHLPLGFSQLGEAFVPVALQGLRAGQNLWVDGAGHWRGGYIPALYRAYPFTLARHEQRHILCVDQDSGLINEDSTGRPFFDTDNKPVDMIRQITDFLRDMQASRQATMAQCAALQAQNLIVPWPLQVRAGEQKQTLEGLYQIDEEALNNLSSEAFETLRQAGVLPMIYCQLLSMRHVRQLAALAQSDNQPAQKGAQANGQDPAASVADDGNLDLSFLNNNPSRLN